MKPPSRTSTSLLPFSRLTTALRNGSKIWKSTFTLTLPASPTLSLSGDVSLIVSPPAFVGCPVKNQQSVIIWRMILFFFLRVSPCRATFQIWILPIPNFQTACRLMNCLLLNLLLVAAIDLDRLWLDLRACIIQYDFNSNKYILRKHM